MAKVVLNRIFRAVSWTSSPAKAAYFKSRVAIFNTAPQNFGKKLEDERAVCRDFALERISHLPGWRRERYREREDVEWLPEHFNFP